MRYVAIGDSFTEGVGDELPDGTVRGWADLVAAGLAATGDEPVEYANLAVRGRLLRPIVTDQLDRALALRPRADLLTINGGGNDMLRPGVDLDALVALMGTAVRRCLDAGVRPVVISGADPSAHVPFGRTVRRRGAALTAGVAAVCEPLGVTLVSAFGDAELRERRYWSADRLHLAAAGHRRVAALVLHALGAGPPPPGPAAAAAVAGSPAGPGGELRYYREHVVPWVRRRLTGRSSGDLREAKFPAWHPVQPVA